MKHGYRYYPLYQVWVNMKKRCYNKDNKQYKDYGGRGIIVCDEWMNPKIFIEWCLANGWEKGLQIDRRDNDGNYDPDNCRFVTPKENSLNRGLLRSDNTSGYRGVSHYGENWYSYIYVDRVKKHLGCFDSPVLAALRYDAEAYRLNDGRPMNFL
jgi:hypothetical protein